MMTWLAFIAHMAVVPGTLNLFFQSTIVLKRSCLHFTLYCRV